MVHSETELQRCLMVAQTVQIMVEEGLVENASGNISIRDENPEEMIITPGSYSYRKLTIGDLVKVNITSLEVTQGFRPPSSESPMHAAIYRSRLDVGGIVHTHSRYATAWSTLAQPIPPVHYVIHSIGDEVPVVGYHLYGTEELAEDASEVLKTYNAALLQNHGVICVGATLDDAMKNAIRVEFLAQQMLITQELTPHILTASDLERVRARSGQKKR